MEACKQKGYSLCEGITVDGFMRSAKYGDVVELTGPDGRSDSYIFEAAVFRRKDLCHYVRFGKGGVRLTLIANFKHNKFFDASYLQDYWDIKAELDGCIEQGLGELKVKKIKYSADANETVGSYASFFTGGMLANYFLTLLTYIVNLITLGFTYPLMICKRMNWEVKHTWINGRQLEFTGRAVNLYGKFLLWYFLSVITLGIYYVVKMRLNLIEWQTANTHIKGNEAAVSEFDGKWYQLLGVTLVHNFVVALTLSFGMYWAHCYVERWYAKHTVIDGVRQIFTGTGLQYFGKCFLWTFLSVITLGIYSLWRAIKAKKWTVRHTVFENPSMIRVIPTIYKMKSSMKVVSIMN